MSYVLSNSARRLFLQTALTRAGRGLVNWARAYILWRNRCRAVAALCALDDRSLKDIGLGRSGIRSAILHGRDIHAGLDAAPPKAPLRT